MSRVRCALALVLAIAGCAAYDGRGLVRGQATEEQVEKLMGPSTHRSTASNGERLRYYPRMPYGGEMYVARFGADGKLIALEQRLTEENFSRIRPGTSRADDVRELLGPPHKNRRFPRMERDVWEYPWRGATSPRLLLVYFSYDGVVRELYSIEDPEGVGGEGDG